MPAASTIAAGLAVALALVAAGGCSSNAIMPPPGTVDRYTEQRFSQDPDDAVDVLFVIDDSDGMAEEQQLLARAFPALAAGLRAPRAGGTAGRLPELRVGVVSSSLGAPGSRLAECDRSDRGRLRGPGAPDCAGAASGPFLISLDDGQRNNFSGELGQAFLCAAALGTGGCGFEQHLAAARRALGPDQPLENEGFLRPQALLALVVVADEDDCSAPPITDLFEPSADRYGPQRSFRCNQHGHLCAGRPPSAASAGAPLADCQSAEEAGKLTPVAELVRFFQALKPSPERVLAAVLAGPPSPYLVRTEAASGAAEIAPSCQRVAPDGTGVAAAPAVRLEQFARGFGPRGSFASICDPDLGAPLARLGERVVQQLGVACLSAPPVRLAPDTDPGAVDCQISERVGSFGQAVPVPRCPAGSGGPRPCWTLVANRDRCDTSGWELKIQRGETPPRPNTVATVRCRTCGLANDPRCP